MKPYYTVQLMETVYDIDAFIGISRHFSRNWPLPLSSPAVRKCNEAVNYESRPGLVDNGWIIRTVLCDCLES